MLNDLAKAIRRWTEKKQLMCHVDAGPENKTTTGPTTKSPWATSEGAGSNKAQCGNQGSPHQDPRDHKEQPSRHDIHPDTLKQTPTKPGRNESGEKNYRSETGE